jgi:drug/metabolite transporter (DMT)-like permease
MQPDSRAIAPFDLFLLLLLGVLWGMPYALNKITLAAMPPITMVAVRVALAAAALWSLAFINGCKLPSRVDDVVRLFVQGLIGSAIPYVLIAIGQRSVDSAQASILNSTGPLFICLLGYLGVGPAPLTARSLLGIMMGLAGVIVITGTGALAGFSHASLGQAAILGATLSSAFGAIHARRFNTMEPEVVAAAALTFAALLLLPFALLVESPLHTVPSPSSVVALLVNAFIATALGFVVYFRLIRTLGSLGTTSVGYLRPAVGVLIGCTLLGEGLTPSIVIGLCLILVGVAAINLKAATVLLKSIVLRIRRAFGVTVVVFDET